jgi:ssDNA-binding Zn-finger/Zn-ribbon topoisomerase 1
MGAKKAKTAQKGGAASSKQLCPDCGNDTRIVMYTGYGPRGFFWVCENKGCGFKQRTS